MMMMQSASYVSEWKLREGVFYSSSSGDKQQHALISFEFRKRLRLLKREAKKCWWVVELQQKEPPLAGVMELQLEMEMMVG